MKFIKKFFPRKPTKIEFKGHCECCDDPLPDSIKIELENARKFFKENPFTPEMLEKLRRGESVRVDAGR